MLMTTREKPVKISFRILSPTCGFDARVPEKVLEKIAAQRLTY